MACDCDCIYYPQDLPKLSEEDEALSGDINKENLVVGWWANTAFRLNCTLNYKAFFDLGSCEWQLLSLCLVFFPTPSLTPIISLTDQLPRQPEIAGALLYHPQTATADVPEKNICANVFNIQNRPQRSTYIYNGRELSRIFAVNHHKSS